MILQVQNDAKETCAQLNKVRGGGRTVWRGRAQVCVALVIMTHKGGNVCTLHTVPSSSALCGGCKWWLGAVRREVHAD